MTASRLERALRAEGIRCRIESRDRLAIVVTPAGTDFAAPGRRARAIELARGCGFTHVALEICDPADGAALLRD